MNTDLGFLIHLLKKEVWLKWKVVVAFYLICSIIFLVAAWIWPRVYTSTSVILVEQQSILSPLMRGTAVTTDVVDRAKIASQVIFSKKSLARVLSTDSWKNASANERTASQIERLMSNIRDKTRIKNAGENLIEINYSDVDPKKAFVTTRLLTEIFIDESLNAKQEESRSAFDFIDNQVKIYQNKLRGAEKAIKEFMSKNVDSTPGAKDNANTRLVELKREIEVVELAISAEKSSILVRKKQLSGETNAETNASFKKEEQLNLRITDLQTRLEDLRLNYKDTYPDIVQLKGQINTLKESLLSEAKQREELRQSGQSKKPTGTVAQELRSNMLLSETKIIALNSKLHQLQRLTERERDTLGKINAVEAEIAELNRDYNVNQTMYQDLLGQRENARISMNIDIDGQGQTMKLQDPAALPTIPKGIRFGHIILAGLVLSFILPILLIYGLTLLDNKVRNELFFREVVRIPVIGKIYDVVTPNIAKQNIIKISIMAATVVGVWLIYGYAIFIRLQG